MRKFFPLLTIFFFSAFFTKAQTKNLWATTTVGGQFGYGTILKSDSSGNNFSVVASFNQANGSFPNGSLIMIANGTIYGTTRRGGLNDSCIIFSFDTATQTITNVYDFMSAPQLGALPTSGMVLGNDCKFYGMNEQGGTTGDGTIYSFDPATGSYNALFDFVVDSIGTHPNGELLQLNNGKFYGLTGFHISYSPVLFSFDPATSVYTVLHNFTFATGNNPYFGNLIQATNGKLFGMTRLGGANNRGVIFSYDVINQVYANVYDFIDSTGSKPTGSLMQASNGNLYGMTTQGGSTPMSKGVLFSFDISSNIYTRLVDFNGINGAFDPNLILIIARGLTQASNGKLYGTTQAGGIHNCGVIFSYDIQNNYYNKVLDFDTLTTGAVPDCYILETGGIQTNPCLLAITEVSNDPFSVYPNPTANILKAHFRPTDLPGRIDIINNQGEIILSETLIDPVFNKDISFLSAGLYLLRLTSASNEFVKRIVVYH